MALFAQIEGLVFDQNGNLYAADSAYNIIRKITPDGMVSTFVGSTGYGYQDSTPEEIAEIARRTRAAIGFQQERERFDLLTRSKFTPTHLP